MFASLTTVRGPAATGEAARMAGEAMLSWLREFDGYRGLVILSTEEAGNVRIITLWDSKDALEASEPSRRVMRERLIETAGAELESAEAYEIVLSDGL
jgi:heme-degrading monooxygenase HmoA